MSDLNQLRFGQPEPPATWRALRAGPLSLYFDPASGDLRYVRLGEREVLRRVYVAVRDRNWGTIPPAVRGMHLEEGEDSFSLRFLVVHHQDEISFGWAAEVTGDANGRITYSMVGSAQSSFLSNRTGICVLHPAQECAGLPCTVEHTDGSRDEGRFPLYIAPHQPFMEIRSLTYPVAEGVNATVTFEGDVFEMEDQRNWTDASFKTYSTPLEHPIPKLIRAGVQLTQSVTLTLEGTTQERSSSHPAAGGRLARPSCVVGGDPLGPLPRIGLNVAADPAAHADTQVERLRALRPSHLRWEMGLDGEWEDDLWEAVGLAQAVEAPLELAAFLGPETKEHLDALATILPELGVPVQHLLLYDEDGEGEAIEPALARLAEAAPEAALGGGTYRYFTELNRARPPLRWADLVCYSLNPQVHAFDHASLVETLPMHAWTASSARRLYPHLPIAVTPVTLTPRPRRDPSEAGSPPRPTADARQPSLFAAGWTVGSLKYLAQAGVRSVTYYETAGPAGVMAATEPAGVYPVFHVLAEVLEHPEALVLPTLSSDPLRLEALALRWGDRTRVLAANLSLEPLEAELRGLGQVAWVRRLDETTVASERLRSTPGELHATPGGTLALSLSPCGLAIVDTW